MIKKFSKFRDKLTLKQATIISVIIPLLLSVLLSCIIADSFFENFGIIDSLTITCFLMLSVTVFGILFLITYSILRVEYKQDYVRNEDAKAYVIANYNLSYEEYTELNYCLDEALLGASDPEIITILWERANYTFWVKLIEKDEVELIIKDTNNVVYNDIISNFQFIKAYFKPLN